MAKLKVHRLRSVFALLVLLAAEALPLGAPTDAVADAPTEIRIAGRNSLHRSVR